MSGIYLLRSQDPEEGTEKNRFKKRKANRTIINRSKGSYALYGLLRDLLSTWRVLIYIFTARFDFMLWPFGFCPASASPGSIR